MEEEINLCLQHTRSEDANCSDHSELLGKYPSTNHSSLHYKQTEEAEEAEAEEEEELEVRVAKGTRLAGRLRWSKL